MTLYRIYLRRYLNRPSDYVATIPAKNTKQAFTKAVKGLPTWHSSRIRVERV